MAKLLINLTESDMGPVTSVGVYTQMALSAGAVSLQRWRRNRGALARAGTAILVAVSTSISPLLARAEPGPQMAAMCDYAYARLYELEVTIPRNAPGGKEFHDAGETASRNALVRYEDQFRKILYVRSEKGLRVVDATLRAETLFEADRKKAELLGRLGLPDQAASQIKAGCDAVDLEFNFEANTLKLLRLHVYFN
jgi:hypothetical protein